MSKITPSFVIQAVFSSAILFFCLFSIYSKDLKDSSAYWSMAGSILAYWLPSPAQGAAVKDERDSINSNNNRLPPRV